MKKKNQLKSMALCLLFSLMTSTIFVACSNDEDDYVFQNSLTKATRSAIRTEEKDVTIDERELDNVDSVKIYEPFDKVCRIYLTATADITVNVKNSGGMLVECIFKAYDEKLDTLPYHYYYNDNSKITRIEAHLTASDSIAIYYEATLDADDSIYDPVRCRWYQNPAASFRGDYTGVEYFGVPWHMEPISKK